MKKSRKNESGRYRTILTGDCFSHYAHLNQTEVLEWDIQTRTEICLNERQIEDLVGRTLASRNRIAYKVVAGVRVKCTMRYVKTVKYDPHLMVTYSKVG
jgi:hypothetical protein